MNKTIGTKEAGAIKLLFESEIIDKKEVLELLNDKILVSNAEWLLEKIIK